MPATLEAPPALEPRAHDRAAPPAVRTRHAGGDVRRPDPPDGGGDGDRRNWPIGLAIVAIVLLAAALTYVGMIVGGVWPNLAGSQLPGA